ncbi:hypothetical protein DTL42_08375 [Bremerella cremea]|uniref:Uncharacterized protein n=1 Tax=Bremerella cremea TaxID=1031537 RepID=A0A368KTD3_9BACT|nr:hypothetical protein [Bremerella cremea]RCS52838.1 hypothetical protein DTL42_08375 [Bremerella cremea]
MHRTAIIANLLWLALCPLALRGEVVELSNGRQLDATPVHNSARAQASQVELEVGSFGTVVLPKEQIRRVESPQISEDAYFDEASKYADTAEDQWKLAQWCSQNGLEHSFLRHAQHVLELDPNFAPARHVLGYQQRGTQWVSQDELQRERGYIRHDGKWMTVQEAALAVAHEKHKQRLVDWSLRLRRWRQQLGKSKAPEVQIDFENESDPDMVPGLISLLGDEANSDLVELYIRVLGRIDSYQARTFLMENAVFQNNPNHRLLCQREVVRNKDPRMVEFYASFLRSYDNAIVNRTAEILGLLDYPTAIGPLASALQTRHLAPHSANYTYFYTAARPTLFFDINGPRASYRSLTLQQFLSRSNNAYDTVWIENHGVRQALIKICDGEDFGFDPAPWKAWYKKAYAPQSPNIRLSRDH